jgi:hypothetical protein
MPGRPRTRLRRLLEAETKLVEAILEVMAQASPKVQAGRYRDDPLGGIWRRVDGATQVLIGSLTALNTQMIEHLGLPDSFGDQGDPLVAAWNRVVFRVHNGIEADAGHPPLTEDETFERGCGVPDSDSDSGVVETAVVAEMAG